MTYEQVVLVDDDGEAIGVAAKVTVHHRATPLHLAFSAYVLNPRGEVLLTRRAASKKTWPSAWTNSCCGHPAPGEALPDAVRRRLSEELGLEATEVDLVLPRFRYRAQMWNGIVENELCPVYRVRVDGEPSAEPAEVSATEWVRWPDFVSAVASGRLTVTPWCLEQLGELSLLSGGPQSWPVAPAGDLPRAARGNASVTK